MADPKTKSKVLQAARDAYAEMQTYLASLTPEQRVAPLLDDGWSVKDSLAHIAAWENMTIGWLEASLRGEYVKRFTPEFIQPDDQADAERMMNDLNNHLFEQNRNRSWEQVLADFNESYQRILAVIARMSDDDIFNPQRFAWRKGSPAIDMIAANTYGHYAEHLEWIRQRFGEK